jgi:hypothetical protein
LPQARVTTRNAAKAELEKSAKTEAPKKEEIKPKQPPAVAKATAAKPAKKQEPKVPTSKPTKQQPAVKAPVEKATKQAVVQAAKNAPKKNKLDATKDSGPGSAKKLKSKK